MPMKLLLLCIMILKIAFANQAKEELELEGHIEAITQCVKCHGTFIPHSIKDKNLVKKLRHSNMLTGAVLRDEYFQNYFNDDAKKLIHAHHKTKANIYFKSVRFFDHLEHLEYIYTGKNRKIRRTLNQKAQKLYYKNCRDCHGSYIKPQYYSYELKKYFDNITLLNETHANTKASKLFSQPKIVNNIKFLKYLLMSNAYDTYEGCRSAGAGWPEPLRQTW